MDNCLNSDHLIGIRAKTAAEEVNRLRNWKRTKERFEENKAHIKKDCLGVLSGMSAFSWEKYTAALEAKIQDTWEKMRPENRYGQMTPSERVAFATSDEGKDYLFPLGITLNGKRYETKASGKAVKAFYEESRAIERTHSPEETGNIFRTAFLLFVGQVDAATTFAQNCGGGGSAPDQDWGRDKNEDDILWARRCFRKAREMVTTPVIRWGRRR